MLSLKNTTASTVIFDLDGTLIDSAPAILASLSAAFECCNLSMKVELSSSLIGPPLMETLKHLAGSDQPEILDMLSSAFRQHYDNVGFRDTKPFDTSSSTLKCLHQSGKAIYVATNKRDVPTNRILDLFSWHKYFQKVYAIDSFADITNKTQMLNRIVSEGGYPKNACLYVGDRDDDREAAKSAGIPFSLASWGYSSN